MKLHITNTDTGQATILDERQIKDLVRNLRRSEHLALRGDVTLYIWHGKEAPAPALVFRDFQGRKGATVI
jgi:hypothetical protein